MAFESPLFHWLVLAMLFLVLPVLLFLSILCTRLLRSQSGVLTLALFSGSLLLVTVGAAVWINSAGVAATGEVLEKKELLAYHLDGSWDRQTVAAIRYRPSEFAPPLTDSLELVQSRYDEMLQGDFVPLRYLHRPGIIHLIRLEDQTVLKQLWIGVTQQPFFLLLAIGLYAVLAAKLILRIKMPALLFSLGLIIVGAWWLSGVALPLWRQAAIRTSSLNTAVGDVRDIHRPYLGDDLRAWFFAKLFAPYELVLIDFTPLGHTQRLMAIDVVDPGSAGVKPGDQVSLQYSPGDARFALLGNASRRYLWKNSTISTLLAALALAFVSAVTFLVREER